MKVVDALKSIDIYSFFLPKTQPIVQQNTNINWNRAWKNLNFKFINIREREIVFKLLHNILTTKKRLFQIKRARSPICVLCNVNEDISHMFTRCIKVRILLRYFGDILKNVCNIDNMDIDRILYLDIKAGSKQDTNTAIILTTSYIATVWFNRDTGTPVQPSLYKSCITRHRTILSMILKQKMKEIFSVKYCSFDTL